MATFTVSGFPSGQFLDESSSFIDDKMAPKEDLANRSEFKLTGIQPPPKAAILSIKHKRRPANAPIPDTKWRIFGGSDVPDNSDHILQPIHENRNASSVNSIICGAGADARPKNTGRFNPLTQDGMPQEAIKCIKRHPERNAHTAWDTMSEVPSVAVKSHVPLDHESHVSHENE